MTLRLLVVLNPSARDFNAQERWPEMERRLRQRAEVTLLRTEPDDQRTLDRLRDGLAKGFDRVLAIGGDGTIHNVVNGIATAGLKAWPEFAVIPFGTANNVAKSLRLPLQDLDRMAQIAVGPRLEALDVARLRLSSGSRGQERIWVNCAGVGMDADIVAARGRHRDLKGYLSYAAAMLERSVEQRSMDVSLLIDGRKFEARVFNLILTNVPVYAGTLELPGSRGDGLLDVHLLDRLEYGSKMLSFALKKADLLNLGLSELLETITDNQRTLHGRSIQVRLAEPRRVQIDGEALPEASELDCDVVGRLRVAVP
jgi:diacylglycerol kinase family enzyme